VAKVDVDTAKLEEALGTLSQIKDLLKQFEGTRAVAAALSGQAAPPAAPEPGATATVDAASQAQLKDLTDQVQNLVGVVKQHERDMNAARLQPQSSNAAPVEGGSSGSGARPSIWGVGDFNQVAQREAEGDK
jgi:hypothetical protein